MGFIKPSRPQYDPKKDLRSAGTFLAKLLAVYDTDPDPKYPGSKPRLCFQWQCHEPSSPSIHGMLTASIVTASVYKDPNSGKESNLLKLARMMGIPDPDKGFDPDLWVGRWYTITTQLYDGRAFPIAVVPASAPEMQARGGTKSEKAVHERATTINPEDDIPF